MLQQQDEFESFVHEYNYERPHEALQMKTPSSLYQPSARPYQGLPALEYPVHDRAITVPECWRV